MSATSLSNIGGLSAWQASQQQSGKTGDASSLDGDSAWASIAPSWPPPPPPNAAAPADTTATDGSSTSSATAASAGSAASKLIADLQSFLVNLQSTASADATDGTAAASTAATTADTSTATTAGTSSTAASTGTTSNQGAPNLFADFTSFLNSLESQFANQSTVQNQPATSAVTAADPTDTASATTATATASTPTTDQADASPGFDRRIDHLLDALQSYAAQSVQPAPGGTTSVSA